jgi:DNA replication protein DnaC
MLHNHIVRKLNLSYPVLRFVKSVQLQEQIKEQSMEMFVKRPLIIDEFGRESKTVMDYGNISRPISELLSLRSDVGTITHATSNFTFKTLSSDEFYGGMIGDRLKTMFNFITLHGESRRK